MSVRGFWSNTCGYILPVAKGLGLLDANLFLSYAPGILHISVMGLGFKGESITNFPLLGMTGAKKV